MSWRDTYTARLVSAEEAVSVVRSGDTVHVAYSDEPPLLVTMLQARAGEIENVTVEYSGPGLDQGWFEPGMRPYFRIKVQNTFRSEFRDILHDNRAEFVPFLFTLSLKAQREREWARPDVYLVSVSPPDEEGYCSFGHSLWNKRAYIDWSRIVLAEVNARHIRTCGDNRVHVGKIDCFVENTPAEPEPYYSVPEPDDVARQMGHHIGSLIDHGDTIQIGWSNVAMSLPAMGVFDDKLDLGIHAEITAPGIPQLVQAGVINGKRKTLNPDVAVVTSLNGAGKDMELAVDNPLIHVKDVDYTNDIKVIAAHDNMVAINGAASVDLTGQINVENNPELVPINGPGGQPEFVIGALMSKGGRSITALRSTNTDASESRIVHMLREGSTVTIPRTLADYVVTEYGVAKLLGRSLKERAEALVSIAHPDFRTELQTSLKARFYSHS